MSALDFTARALALRAVAQTQLCFEELARAGLPASVARIQTSGFANAGDGGHAVYLRDPAVDAAYVAAHPKAAFLDGSGPGFRLLPQQATISPEMLGCPRHAPGVNQQPWLQAAIRYAEALKCGLHFEQNTYEVWTPLRVPDAAGNPALPVPSGEPGNFTGLPLIITRKVEMRAAPGGTTIVRRTWNGGDPAVMADIQDTADAYGYRKWRGGLFALIPQAVRPADPDDLASIVLHGDFTLIGGVGKSATPGLYAADGKYRIRPDGTAWDIYDKAFWYFSENGIDYVGKLIEVYGNLVIDGFAGESFFGGVYSTGLTVRGKIEVRNSDAGHFDFGLERTTDAVLDADLLWAHDVYLGIERCCGWHNRIGHLKIEDCNVAGNLWGGDYTDSDGATMIPDFRIGTLEVSRCGTPGGFGNNFSLRKNVTVGEVVCRDTGIGLGDSSDATFLQRNISVGRVRAIADTASGFFAVAFSSATPGAGTFGLRDCNVGEIVGERTPLAVANNRMAGRAARWNGNSIGDRCFVGSISGEFLYPPDCSAATPADFHVGIQDCRYKFNTGGNFWNGETTPTLADGRAFYELLPTSPSGNFAVTMPSPAKYPAGSRVRLRNRGGSSQVFTVARTNTDLSKRALLPANTGIWFELIAGHWVPLGEMRHVLTGSSGAVSLQKAGAAIPAGDVSDEVTFTVIGARAQMNVRVTPATVIGADAQLIGRVTANDTVGIRARNLNLGAALAIGAAAYNVELEWGN